MKTITARPPIIVIGAIAILGLTCIFFETQQNPSRALEGPSLYYLFGADALGRDLFARTFAGALRSLFFGILSAIGTWTLGVLFGFLSAWIGGLFDKVFLRLCDIVQALPNVLVASIVIMIFSSLPVVIAIPLAIAIASWPLTAKLSRALVLQERSKEYVLAAKALGASPIQQLLNHILPNAKPSLMTHFGLQIGYFLTAESLLSFIGIGLQPPYASLGVLLQEGWKHMLLAPHTVLFPSFILFIMIFSFNLIFVGKTENEDRLEL